MYALSRFAFLALLAGISLQAVATLSHDTCADEPLAATGRACLSISQQHIRSSPHQRMREAQNVEQQRQQNLLQKEERQLQQQPQSQQSMKSTPDGICMYTLPDKFNVGLLDSQQKMPEPKGRNISPTQSPPLQGMFDTNQFSLERIFFERMTYEATEHVEASKCKLFYVPYFASWETSSVQGLWIKAYKPGLDTELLTHLTFLNTDNKVERNHFTIVGRIASDLSELMVDPRFERLIKFSIEDSYLGKYSNVFGIPYPTWFRYYPALEPKTAQLASPSSISVTGAQYRMDRNTTCDSEWLGNLTLRMSSDCVGHSWCSVFISPPDDVTNTSKCPVLDVAGTYTCGEYTNYTFMTNPGEVATGRAVVLSCNQGPRWLLNSSEPPETMASGTNRQPLVSFVGSIEPLDRIRPWVSKMCQERPNHCIVLDTWWRTHSSTSVPGRQSDMYQLLMASTFCLNAPGDSPTRKGIFDALVLGCIPVVFTEDSLQFYRLHLPNWRSLAVLVTSDRMWEPGFNVVDHLENYMQNHPEEVQQKQRAIRDAAYSLQYSLRPGVQRGPDAFDVIMRKLLSDTSFAHDKKLVLAESGLSKMNVSFRPAKSTRGSSDDLLAKSAWRIQGVGDGTCCYRIVDSASGQALYDEPGPTNIIKQVAAGSGKKILGLDRWRITGQDSNTFTITNVASGRQLFAQDGQQSLSVFGARGNPSSLTDQKWEIIGKSLF